MRDKPILMNGEMVRAILRGIKTQTRRPVKPQPAGDKYYVEEMPTYRNGNPNAGIISQGGSWIFNRHGGGFWGSIFRCNYGGSVGDRLWVRETWSCIGAEGVRPSAIAPGYTVCYRADPVDSNWRVEKWRPSIHMPRWACRLELEITGVKVHRVQSISRGDMIAEGCAAAAIGNGDGIFADLWDSIYGETNHKYGNNPWVWAVAFKMTQEAATDDPTTP